MSDLTLGITLKADGSGFVGTVKVAKDQLDQLGAAAGAAGQKGTPGLNDMGGALGRLKSLALGAVAGFAGFASVERIVAGTLAEVMAFEKSQANLQAVLRATGNAAGLTAEQINRMTDQLERATLFDDAQIRQAASVLLTFRNVSGEAFGRALSLATDLAALMGGDLQGATLQLGKALQSPAEGLAALRRSGISFSDQQQKVIQSLVDTGRQAEAMRLILDGVSRQVGGTAKSQVVGLTGAVNTLGDAWGGLLKSFKDTQSYSWLVGFIDSISAAIRRNTTAINERSLADVEADIDRAQKALGYLKGLPNQLTTGGVDLFTLGFRSLGIDLGETTNEKIASVTKALGELEEKRRELLTLDREGSAGGMGGGAGGGDSSVSIALQKEEAAFKVTTTAVQGHRAALAQLLYDQEQELRLNQLDAREREIATAVIKAQEAALADYRDGLRDSAQLTEAETQKVIENTEAKLDQADASKRAAAQNEVAGRSIKRSSEIASDATQVITKGLEDMVVAGGSVGDMLISLWQDIERILFRLAVTKPLESAVGSIFDQILGSLGGGGGAVAKGPKGGGSSFWDSILGAIFHDGGVVGGAAPGRLVPASLFARAPRFHQGGQVWGGLVPGEVPVIARKGEEIGWPDQLAAKYGSNVQVVVVNNTGQAAQTQERQGANGRRIVEVTIGDAVAQDIRGGGPIAQMLERTYALGRGRV